MLAASLGRDVHHTSLEELQQSLLHPFAGDIPRNGRIVALAGYLVYLVYEDYPALGHLHIVVRLLQEPGEYALHILPDVARLRKDSGVNNGEGHFEKPGDGLSHQCLSGPCRPDHEDVGFLEFEPVVRAWGKVVVYPLVVVVDRYRKKFLGPVLPYHILVEICLYLLGLHQLVDFVRDRLRGFLKVGDIVAAYLHAVAADCRLHALEKERYFALAPSAEHAVSFFIVMPAFCHSLLV